MARGTAALYVDRDPTYESNTGRFLSYGGSNIVSTHTFFEDVTYDAAGNRTRYHTDADDDYLIDIESFYNAADQMVAMERRLCEMHDHSGQRVCEAVAGAAQPRDTVFADQSVYQEYRYDALGRRVLTYSNRADSAGHGVGPSYQCDASNCAQYIERTVWDGNQILFEIRYPLDELSKISGVVSVSDGLSPYGVVGYVPGPEIDKPYLVERQFHDDADSTAVEWVYTIEDGLGWPVQGFESNGDPIDCLIEEIGCEELALDGVIPWPHLETRTDGELMREGPGVWMGSLVTKGADPSGLMYRRARYYDPMAGQFTQEDPIGLAGE